MFLEVVLGTVLAYLAWYYLTSPPPRYPPMPPIRLPFIGHGFYIMGFKNMQEAVRNLSSKYAKDGIVVIHLGPIRWVFLSDLNLVKEAFKKEELNYRFRNDYIHTIVGRLRGDNGKHGIINSSEKTWTEQRRFTLRTLRDFGFGKTGMEDLINAEVAEFIPYMLEEAAKSPNCALVMQNVFNVTILNALWKIIAGSRYNYRDPELLNLTKKVNDAITSSGPKMNLAFVFPWVRKIWPNIDAYKANIERTLAVKEFVASSIEEHRKTFNPDDPPRDFIDVYLGEIDKETDPNSSFYDKEGDCNLVNTLIDLFFAGSETTSSTLSWAILFLIGHPDVQDKVRKEVHQIVGPDRLPHLSDKALMPYTEATIQEIQRLGNIAPLGLPHSTYKSSVAVGDYIVPQGHTFHSDMGSIMSSPKTWGQDCKEFRPERFLKDGNSLLLKDEKIIPFLVGKRQCPGENLARAEIFLYLTGLLQKLEFTAEDSDNPPSPNDYVSGITAMPTPFKAIVRPFVYTVN